MTILTQPPGTVVAAEITPEGDVTIVVAAPAGDPMVTARALSAAVSPSPVHLARCQLEDGTEVYPTPSTRLDPEPAAPDHEPVRLVLSLRRRHAGQHLDGLVRADAVHRVEAALQRM